MKPPFGNARDAHVSTELISVYLDNQMASDERLRVEHHLRTCAACRTELNSLRQTISLLQALPRMSVPRPFTLSEAQVGARPRAKGSWVWGAARVFGAVAALLVVAVLAVQILQRPGQQAAEVARLAQPAAAPAPTASAEPAPLLFNEAPAAAAPTLPQPDLSLKQGASEASQPTAQPVQKPSVASPTRPQAATATRAQAPLPAAAPAPAAQPTTAAAAAPKAGAATAPRPVPTQTSAGAAMARAAQPTEAISAMGLAVPQTSPLPSPPTGRGGGTAGGPPAPGQAADSGPLLVLPSAPLSLTLPQAAGVVYADGQSLIALDTGGERPLVNMLGINSPSIAPDRSWVAYQVPRENNSELWAVRWDGSGAHMLANTRDFPTRDGTASGPVQIQRVQWVPGGHTLSLQIATENSTESGQPRTELWTLNAETGARQYVLDPGLTGTVAFAPDGKHVALLERGNQDQPQGRLDLYNADGGGQRNLLQFPANVNGFGYESQLSWWPDSSGLWAAIPDPNVMPPETRGISLYRVPVQTGGNDGAGKDLKPVGHIASLDTFWSPDGKHLAYSQPIDETAQNRELVLANADGTQPRIYTTVGSATLDRWSPDSRSFVYLGDQWYLGSLDQAPQALGPIPSLSEPHWVAPDQLLYLVDQGQDLALVSRGAQGLAASLARIPKAAGVAMTGR